MNKKYRDFGQHWNNDESHSKWTEIVDQKGTEFDYSTVDSLAIFKGTHPAVMKEKIEKENWNFEHNINEKKFKNTKHRFLYFLDKKFGFKPFAYRNYKII